MKKLSSGFWMMVLIIGGLGLAALGYAKSESVGVAELKPLSHAIHVANLWIWACAVPGCVLCATGFIWLGIKSMNK